jgi:ATP-dependent RNA helicase RhlE
MGFTKLGLSDSILEAVKKKGYDTPSPIQEKSIPLILEGKDVMAAAQTGTGKTAGFTLPILQLLSKGKLTKSNQVRTLILTPTRELAAQVQDSVSTYGRHLPLKSAVVFGGVKINPQMQKLRGGVDILVATPGRLLDLHSQNAVKFDELEIIVFDEADRMLDMGFLPDIKRILKTLPDKRQTLMFSATFSDEIRKLAKSLVHNPVEISTAVRNTTVKSVKQWIHPVDKSKKQALLTKLIEDHGWYQVLVFSRTKHGANRIATQLGKKGITAAAIHGNKSQGARTRALADFKNGKVNVLVATDIAARGIDITDLPHVVNFDLPHVPEDYVHRIGRTGRAGSKGEAISLVSADEVKQLFDIERLTQKKLERIMVDDFVPDHNLPESLKNQLPPKKKKPKKNNPRNKPRYGKGGNSKDKKDNKKKSFWDSKPRKKPKNNKQKSTDK